MAEGDSDVTVTVKANNGAQCTAGCTASKAINGGDNFSATIRTPNVGTGQKQQVTVSIEATKTSAENGTETGSANASFTVEGEAAPAATTVRQVSGRIKDDENKRVSGVKVVMKDSVGKVYNTTTNGDGGYSFTSSDSQPITAGSITVAATKDGYDSASATVQGSVGRTVNVPLTLKKVAAASPSASPSASASASAAATDEATDEEEPTEEETNGINLGQDTNEAANNSDDGGSNWLLIIMGVLLVAAGLGAMLLVWLRRKKAEELAAETGIGKIPPATGGGDGFDQTRVAAPVGAGRGGDATMIAPAGGMGGGGSLGDAPTVIHRQPVEDEFPDPYGAPLPANGGYHGQQTNQWGNDGADDNYGGGNYGGGTQPYGQQGGGGYGAPQGGQQRFDEHTNMYQPDQPQVPQQQQRYDEATGMYQPEQGGGYGQQGGYDQGGYGQQQGGWDNGHQQQGGYDQGGWDNGQQGGYGQQQPQQHQGGWDDDQQGYDQRGNGYGNNNGQNRNWNG